jgi:pimeloyl-ACP methyl ester carboxylesterase
MSISDTLGERRVAQLPQGPVVYRERGEGPPVLFIHGFLVNGDLWRHVVPLLADGYRCITPDWPLGSHELAMDDDADLTPPGLVRLIDDFMAELGLDDVVVVGNDTGGALAQMLVTTRPERVGRLVLTPCDSFRNFPAWWSKPLRPVGYSQRLMWLVGQPLRSRRVQRLPLVYGWVSKTPFPPDIARSYVGNGLRDAGVRRDFGRAFRSTRVHHTMDAARLLHRFDRPALVVWQTDRARIYPVEHGRRLARLLPQARLELVEDSYIYVPEDQPERLAALMRDFLAAT